jgi:beta-glucanase (GH16 family)
MEYYRGLILANVAWSARDNPPGHSRRGHQIWEAWWDDRRIPLAELGGAEWARGFHVWRLDWDEHDIRIYVDDRLLKHVELKHTENTDGESAFRRPHYLLLNLAVGGTQGGDPSMTEFPGRFEVDYVRVYQKQAAAGTDAGSGGKQAGAADDAK